MSHIPPNDPSATPVALYVGIDVSKDQLDMADNQSDQVIRLDNNPDGIGQITAQLATRKPAVVVVESTGGLERSLVDALLEAEIPVALVHPGRVRYFARGLGVMAKTDRIDAKVLVQFARLACPRLKEKVSQNQLELRDLVVCRRQLIFTRTQQSNRLGTTVNKLARRSIEAVLKTLATEIQRLEKMIRDLIDADDDFKHLDKLLQSVPGVGDGLSSTLAADLPELGTLDSRRLAALVGVAPFNHESGKFRGKRAIRGGRVSLRCTLYMATHSAMRCNPVIKAFALRLKASAKPPKVVIVACMRKLLTLINAMIAKGLSWEELNVVKKLSVLS
jgi:transposase